MIRLLCVEDDPLMRTYLATRLQAEPDIQVVGSVPDTQRAMIHLRLGEIDVVLLDYHLQGLDGTSLIQSMSPWTRWSIDAEDRPAVLFCTGFADEAFRAKARLLGARGVVAKDRMVDELLPAIRAVAHGGTWFPTETPARP
jgi:DNA-binding NarL/FixJ family response regulator